jgi:2-phosphosulfolactate phosphatase
MGCQIQVLFAPAEFRALRQQDLACTTCVVFDVLRATSTMVAALANGAAGIIPVEEISEAIALRRERPDALLAGERNGLRISGALTAGVEFDLGNSPGEYTSERVKGRTIISTTTNGTRALRACAAAETVLIGSFLNFSKTVDFVVNRKPRRLLLICAGTGENAALEDAVVAGAFCGAVIEKLHSCEMFDSAEIASRAYRQAQQNLLQVIQCSQNGRRLMANAELREDVAFCLRLDYHPIAAGMGAEGIATQLQTGDEVGITMP